MNVAAQWDTSVLVAFWIAGIMLALGLILGVTGFVRLMWFEGDSGAAGSAIAGACLFLLSLVIAAVAWLPGSQYDRYVPYTGTVAKVTTRFLGDGQSVNQVFGITFANGDVRRCNDTRCSGVTKGDKVTLLCERVFQFNQPNEGWDCNFVDRTNAG